MNEIRKAIEAVDAAHWELSDGLPGGVEVAKFNLNVASMTLSKLTEEIEKDRTRLEWLVHHSAEVLKRERYAGYEFMFCYWFSEDQPVDTEWSSDWRGLIDGAMRAEELSEGEQ